jgi:hypothetical protein
MREPTKGTLSYIGSALGLLAAFASLYGTGIAVTKMGALGLLLLPLGLGLLWVIFAVDFRLRMFFYKLRKR